MKRRLLITAGLCAGLLALWAWASFDRCGEWPLVPPKLTQLTRGKGSLRAGAAKVALTPTFPTTVGGYPPPRSTVDHALEPLHVRALVLEAGGQRLGLVLLDALLIPPQLRDAIGKGQPFPTWVLATHTHSGPSGFDPRLSSELAALGTFAPQELELLSTTARAALAQALAALTPVHLERGEASTEGLVVPRSGAAADARVTRLRFDGATGPVAQLVIASGHPTLISMRPGGLHPDWPGLLAGRLERDAGPITLVLQGAGGNASLARGGPGAVDAVADLLEAKVKSIVTAPQPEDLEAAWDEVHVALPRPQWQGLLPAVLGRAAENALCDDAEDVAVLHGLRLGDERLLFVPFEPSLLAGQVLEEQSKTTRVVSLADGYAGYLETVEVARAGEGESRRQYFGPDLLRLVTEGAQLAGQPLR